MSRANNWISHYRLFLFSSRQKRRHLDGRSNTHRIIWLTWSLRTPCYLCCSLGVPETTSPLGRSKDWSQLTKICSASCSSRILCPPCLGSCWNKKKDRARRWSSWKIARQLRMRRRPRSPPSIVLGDGFTTKNSDKPTFPCAFLGIEPVMPSELEVQLQTWVRNLFSWQESKNR